MKITQETLYSDFVGIERYLKEGEAERLKAKARAYYFPNGFWSMRLADFFSCCHGDFACFGINSDTLQDVRVFQIYAIKAFQDFVGEFCDTLGKLSTPHTIDEQVASEQCIKVSFEEGIIMFARDFFSLKSYGEAYELTLFDYLLARKQAYNKDVYQRKLNEIAERKIKTKIGKR